MSDKTFSQGYADEYDTIYGDKDYESECDSLESIFTRYGNSPIKTILDVGCGTGSHAIPLARRGYTVTGMDRSQSMLDQANKKIRGDIQLLRHGQIEFLQGDARDLRLERKFDAVLMMFSVLGLQTTNSDVFSALRSVRQNLNPGGIFVFDVWYGPAVLTIRPSDRIKIMPTENGQLIRSASGSLDIFHHLCGVQFHLWRLNNSRLVNETDETQWTRYFFPQELAFFMNQAGLDLINMSTLGDLDQMPTDETWNILVVGKAI